MNAMNMQELSLDEIDQVSGGIPVGLVIVAGIAIIGVAAGIYSGYIGERKPTTVPND